MGYPTIGFYKGSSIRGLQPLKAHTHQKFYTAFRAKLKEARQKANLTQADVAKAIGQPQSFVSKCESGERRVDFIELQEFVQIVRGYFGIFRYAVNLLIRPGPSFSCMPLGSATTERYVGS